MGDTSAAYQLLVLGEPIDEWSAALQADLADGLDALGLDPGQYLRVVRSGDAVDWKLPVAAVWLAAHPGPAPPEQVDVLPDLLERGVTVVPVVAKLDRFREVVPGALHPNNALAWPGQRAVLASVLITAFGLAPEQRTAFISYRRRHSRAVAAQVFYRLSDAGYSPFLDTASLTPGVRFQERLWDRMADTDLLVFLATPGAISSRWVDRELTRAHDLGMGVLQLVWPGGQPHAGTRLSKPFMLSAGDFPKGAPVRGDGSPDPSASVTAATLDAIADAAEQVRIRSIGSRRARVVAEVVRAARDRGLEAAVEPAGPVRLSAGGKAMGAVVPVVRPPDSSEIYANRERLAPGGDRVRLVYDGLGVRTDRRAYLVWLNDELRKYRTLSIEELPRWLAAL